MRLPLLLSLCFSVFSILAFVAFKQDLNGHISFAEDFDAPLAGNTDTAMTVGSSTHLGQYTWNVVALKVMQPGDV